MKSIDKMLLALALCTLGVSCNKEELSDGSGKGTVQVKVAIDDGAVKSLSDSDGLKWEAGDQLKYAGGIELTSEPLTAENISEDGHTATFTFDARLTEVDRTGWFCSAKCHPTNYTEVEFTLGADNGNSFMQDAAGEMNSRYIFLHSGTGLTQIAKDQPLEISAEIAGSIFRVLPYTTSYNEEKVLSVKFSSKSKIVGTVAYDRGAGSYRGVSDINYKTADFVKVDLRTPFPLEGIADASSAKGIYFAVAATKEDAPLDGYSYIVETDKADYVFDAMDKQLAVANNTVKNVFLNLDRAERKTAEGGQLKYDGALNLSAIPADGCTDLDAGYWQALTSTDGEQWTAMLNSENSAFYNAVTFDYKDAEGNPQSWLSVRYGGGDLCHWIVNAGANTGEERSVTVTAHFADVKGYKIQESSRTLAVTLTQAFAGSPMIVCFALVSLPSAFELNGTAITDMNAGYCLLNVDGKDDRDWSDTGIYARSRFVYVSEENYAAKNYVTDVDWLGCRYPGNETAITDCVWLVSATANDSESDRTAYVVCLFPEDDAYEFPEPRALKVTQKTNTVVEASFSDIYAETVSAEGGVITAGKLSLSINGAEQTDVAAAIQQYGLSLSSDKGSKVTVASDGTMSMTVPANPYKNGGVTYTVKLVSDGVVRASMTVSQEEGTEEGSAQYTYDLVKYNGNGTGAIWGMNPDSRNGADFRIDNVRLNGEAVTLDETTAAEVLAQAIKCLPGKPENGYDNYREVYDVQINMNVINFNGATLEAGAATTAGAKGYITRLTWYSADGTEGGYWFVFCPF